MGFYLGQVSKIKKALIDEFGKPKNEKDKQKTIRVSTIDNYQGEESDIVLLSLVRSNEENNIGFLRTFNRICVAFSRAKIGFYVIGNMDCIVKGEKRVENKNTEIRMRGVWQKIYEKAKNQNLVSNILTLKCQTHGNKSFIYTYEDFKKHKEGGCLKICGKSLKCGHTC